MSNLDIFKIGIGPSSSHTLGPMLAANLFCKILDNVIYKIQRIETTLYGSLSLTGKGHLTDKAVIWGLNAITPKDITPQISKDILNKAINSHSINLCGKKEIHFIYERDIIFNNDFLPLHQNALIFRALGEDSTLLAEETYYSIGGGFVKNSKEIQKKEKISPSFIGFQVNSAKDLMNLSNKNTKSLSSIAYEYELQFHTKEHIYDYCLEIWNVMQECFAQGCNPKELNLPGPLNLHRRAKGLSERICPTMDPFGIIDYISLYAIAIAEENAGGGRVVTAPTNGACAVIPAVMLYLKNHSIGFNDSMVVDFLLCAMMIGSLYKKNASISGAEAGCQAEIGSASSMAAAAMATVLGANVSQACNAAEIAMEHHLGLTCDPVFGLVQIPCIERNAFGAIKAISAARMAMNRKSIPVVGLDDVINTMYQTGKDMNSKYKETALGGLASTIKNIC
ncbi:L-serine ammonia-lyase [Helicobacter sp. MIT 14-3879]|uniref:L-serine ammonia-lyase n=1 Tax=Helicobacter sp. MIT 14-3879 TaxID=2040649 RepID=UPI000E1ED1B6|nr:L-serine ammonia-lyase [Helicobacter sp. MIT 14-3879]RDU63493.1 L-serine ammonia-lyase [Helicobacter sp. MIT 14-3879]